ncbi:TauD/TfdA family dioxygenase [Pseudomonas sp. 18175]|uniref:TauD/TfdA family dioxygenase n=1 Tax=Pseudomonas sp. 18175 TaxID=3390056 RepID=UPI003D1E71DB
MSPTPLNLGELLPESNTPWDAASLRQRQQQWVYTLSAAQVHEVERALAHIQYCTKPALHCGPDDFPLPTLHSVLQRAALACETRLGLFLIRGLPIAHLSEPLARWLAWGIGLHLGVPLVQNEVGQLMVDVRDISEGRHDQMRDNATSAAMGFHVDACDLASLLCRRDAAHGGHTRIANMLSIHNQLARENPTWLQALYQPLPFFDLARQRFFRCPVFAIHHGVFAGRFYRKRILACRNLPGAPVLSHTTLDAIDAFEQLANTPQNCLEIHLQPGDLQLLNNHVVCHARTAFTDTGQADKKRHLFRQWFATPFSRPLPLGFRQAYGRTEAATLRGGYRGWQSTPETLSFQHQLAERHGVIV